MTINRYEEGTITRIVDNLILEEANAFSLEWDECIKGLLKKSKDATELEDRLCREKVVTSSLRWPTRYKFKGIVSNLLLEEEKDFIKMWESHFEQMTKRFPADAVPDLSAKTLERRKHDEERSSNNEIERINSYTTVEDGIVTIDVIKGLKEKGMYEKFVEDSRKWKNGKRGRE